MANSITNSSKKINFPLQLLEGVRGWLIDNKLLILIISLALFIRVCKLDQIPPSPNWDEVSLGYNAYSILQTGRDEWGTILPSVFRAYGDYKLPLYIYTLVPFIKLFDLNTFSIRFLSATAGTLSVFIFYLILNKLFPTKKFLQLLGTTIIAFSPWSIFISRIALEANLGLTFFLISFYLMISQKYWQSSLFFGLFLFTYNSSRVILPFYVFTLIFLIFKSKYKLKKNIFGFIPFVLLICLFVYQSLVQNATDRYKWVTLLDSGAINQINNLQNQYGRLLVNKATFLSFKVTQNYISHFDPKYVFWNGGSQYQFSLPNFNLIAPLFLPIFLIGLIVLIKSNPTILFYLLISPLPSAITRDAPHVLRSLTFLPFITITIIYGLNYLSKFINSKIILSIFTVVIFLNLSFFWQKYQKYATDYAGSWQYGNYQVAEYIKQHYHDYSQILITKKYGEPHEFLVFNQKYPPYSYQTIPKDWNFHADWYWVDGFDKYRFLNDWEIKSLTSKISQPTLLITSPQNYNEPNSQLLETIYYPNGLPVYDIVLLNEN
ncbi:phospholipid carrier-dependent glycosyltransferase [Candidatus Shapirobacteria bacterium]|nr:phospholipid carrier-dependent glycosyltransferase [Candidatus Shapirobacteria bacterium]